jgi:hypothetical protein
VFDKQDNGDNTGKYNSACDDIDSLTTVGFVAPIPELTTIVLLGIGLIGLGGWLWAGKWKKRMLNSA